MEYDKVQYLIQGIKTDSLAPCVAGIIGSREMSHSFDKAVTYIQDFIRNASATANFSGGANRNIMALDSERGNGGGKRPGGGGGRGPNGKRKPKFTQAEVDQCNHITKAFYPQDQYLKMTNAEKQKVYQNRQRIPPEDRSSNKKARGIASADSEKLLKSIEKLTKKCEQTDRHIASIEAAMSDDELSIFSSEDGGDNRNNPALCRQPKKKKSKKSSKK